MRRLFELEHSLEPAELSDWSTRRPGPGMTSVRERVEEARRLGERGRSWRTEDETRLTHLMTAAAPPAAAALSL